MTTLPEAVAKTREPKQSIAISPAQKTIALTSEVRTQSDNLKETIGVLSTREKELRAELFDIEHDKREFQEELNQALAVEEILVNAAKRLQSVAQGKTIPKATKIRGKAKS